MKKATGTFVVKLEPQDDSHLNEPTIGRRSIDKTFAGDIVGQSNGQMIATMGEVQGSAGYVAMERVRGELDGKKGSFALQHSSTMSRGEPSQSIIVVPDSGTEELAGLTGSMQIIIEDGRHSYEFEYSLMNE